MLFWFPLNPFKSKYQVVHEQKFKDLLSSTCQVSVERRVLDLESEAMRGPGSISTGDDILSLDFFLFSRFKEENANILHFCAYVKNPLDHDKSTLFRLS